MESGIYKIINLVNDKVYIGSAKNFSKRKIRHFKDLDKNKHHQIKLQRQYNKYGKDNFIFEVIEEVPYEKNIILEKENYYINLYNQKENGYNISDAQFGDVLSNHPNKKDIIKRITQTIKTKLQKLTPAERRNKFQKPGESNPNYKGESAKCRQTHKCCNCDSLIKINQKYCKKCQQLPEFNPFYCKKHSEKTIEKIREKAKQRNSLPGNSIKVVIDGITYLSLAKAREATGLSYYNIKKIMNNPDLSSKDVRQFTKQGIPYNLGKPANNSKKYLVNGIVYQQKKELFEKLQITEVQLRVLIKNGNAERLSKDNLIIN